MRFGIVDLKDQHRPGPVDLGEHSLDHPAEELVYSRVLLGEVGAGVAGDGKYHQTS